jgi:hypothetical protein
MSLYRRDWLEAGVVLNTPKPSQTAFHLARSNTVELTGSACRRGVLWRRGDTPAESRRRPSRRRRPWSHRLRPRRTRRQRQSCCGGSSGTPPASRRSSEAPVRTASERAVTLYEETRPSRTKNGMSCGSPPEGLRCPDGERCLVRTWCALSLGC